MMTSLFLLAGTWGGGWAEETDPDSFRVFLRLMGFRCSRIEWSENVDGVPDILAAARQPRLDRRRLCGSLSLRGVPYEDRNFLTHSHGIAEFIVCDHVPGPRTNRRSDSQRGLYLPAPARRVPDDGQDSR
jgi:hypothetical protein